MRNNCICRYLLPPHRNCMLMGLTANNKEEVYGHIQYSTCDLSVLLVPGLTLTMWGLWAAL